MLIQGAKSVILSSGNAPFIMDSFGDARLFNSDLENLLMLTSCKYNYVYIIGK